MVHNNHFRKEHTCYHAALVNLTGLSLQELGIPWNNPDIEDARHFAEMNEMLAGSHGLGRQFVLKKRKDLVPCINVFKEEHGIYLINAYWYHVCAQPFE